MRIEREKNSSQTTRLLAYLGITLTFQFIGFITTFAYSSYFDRTSTFAQSFVFRSSDSPPIPLGFHRPSPFGNHFFGDYLWIYAEIKTNGLGGYSGASQLFLLVASKLPYYLSLIALLTTVLVLLLMSAKLLMSELGLPGQLALLTGGFLFTQPVLLAIDRGQIHLLLFALLLLGLTLSIKEGGDKTWGAILIAAAISVKLTPIFFLLLFVKKRYWKELKVSIISLAGFLLLPLAYLHSGIGAWKFALTVFKSDQAARYEYSSAENFTDNLAFNNSFKLLGYHFSQLNSSLGKVGSFVYEHYYLCAGLLAIFLCWLIVQNNITQFESVLLMAIASSLLIPIAAGYTLMLFILPIVVVLVDKELTFTRSNIVYCCYIGITLMPKQIALGFGTFQNTSITLGGILNPSLSLIIIILIAGKSLYLSRQNFLANKYKLDLKI